MIREKEPMVFDWSTSIASSSSSILAHKKIVSSCLGLRLWLLTFLQHFLLPPPINSSTNPKTKEKKETSLSFLFFISLSLFLFFWLVDSNQVSKWRAMPPLPPYNTDVAGFVVCLFLLCYATGFKLQTTRRQEKKKEKIFIFIYFTYIYCINTKTLWLRRSTVFYSFSLSLLIHSDSLRLTY